MLSLPVSSLVEESIMVGLLEDEEIEAVVTESAVVAVVGCKVGGRSSRLGGIAVPSTLDSVLIVFIIISRYQVVHCLV